MVSPARRRDAVAHLRRRFDVSERRACTLVGQHRSTQRYSPASPEFEQRLIRRMNELASKHPRYGYRRIWALLRGEGFEVNRKRIELVPLAALILRELIAVGAPERIVFSAFGLREGYAYGLLPAQPEVDPLIAARELPARCRRGLAAGARGCPPSRPACSAGW